MSLYEDDPAVRVAKWVQAIWRGRCSFTPGSWRLSFVVILNGRPVGMQDLIGHHFDVHRTVTSFSWLTSDLRGRGIGTEMRQAILQLAFDGVNAAEAGSDAFMDNLGSNAISRKLGYRENGVEWATRRGEPSLLQRWRLTRQDWLRHRRSDIVLHEIAGLHAAMR